MKNEFWNTLNTELAAATFLTDANPVLSPSLNKAQVKFALEQYSVLPAKITRFLGKGVKRFGTFPSLEKEMRRNLAEEQGSRTHGKVHYTILCDALKQEMGVDVTKVIANQSTENFISTVWGALCKSSETYAAGVLYALEASAAPELIIVAKILNRLEANIIDIPAMQDGSATRKVNRAADYNLSDFFVLHIHDFEKGHESGFRNAVNKDFSDNATEEFYAGFRLTLTAMATWWKELSELKGTRAD